MNEDIKFYKDYIDIGLSAIAYSKRFIKHIEGTKGSESVISELNKCNNDILNLLDSASKTLEILRQENYLLLKEKK